MNIPIKFGRLPEADVPVDQRRSGLRRSSGKASPAVGAKPGNTVPANQTPPLLCFHCCVATNMRMAIKVLQASKLLLRRNAPKAHVEKGINIARGMVQDLVDLVGSQHKH